MKKTMGLAGMLVVLMSGCGPAATETEPPSALIQEGQRKAEIGSNQAWLTTYYSDAAMTQEIGYIDRCPPTTSWGSTSIYSKNTIITCVGSAAAPERSQSLK